MTAYHYLALAIVAEVIATSALKASDGFTRPGPTLVVVLGYGLAFWCLSLVLRTIPVGVAYAIWSGAGIALITLFGWVVFRQSLDAAAVLGIGIGIGIGIGLIVAGALVLQLFSRTAVH